jgi:O-antigen/teichoic acid export membrane protein
MTTRSPRPSRGRTIVLAALANFAAPLASFVVAPMIARALGVEGRGQLAAAVALYTLLVVVASAGLPDAITFAVARCPTQLRRIAARGVRMLLVTGALGTVAAVVASLLLSGGRTEVRDLMLLAAVGILPATVLAAGRGAAAGLGSWTAVNCEKYLAAATRLILFSAAFSANVITTRFAVLVTVLAPVAAGGVYARLRGPRGRADPDPTCAAPSSRELLRYGRRSWGGSLSGIVLSRVDQVLMTPLSSSVQLGLYAAAVNVSDLLVLLNFAVRDVMFATQAAKQDVAELTRAARCSLLVGAVLSVVLLAPVNLWFPALFGEDFSGAVPVVVILVAAVLLGIPGSVAGAGLNAYGRPGLRSVSLLVAALANIAGVVVLVPDHGAVGAAVATAVGNLVAANLNIWFAWRVSGARPLSFYAVRRSDVVAVLGIPRLLVSTRGARSG